MKFTTALAVVASVCAIVSGIYKSKLVKYADNDFLEKQKAVFELLRYVHQDVPYPGYYGHINDTEYDYNFQKIYEEGMLPRHQIFSIMNEKHLKEAIALFQFFYYSSDWSTLYKKFLWAKYNTNKDMFIYALTVTVLHRKDMAGIVLPAPYEINPYYFFTSDVIQQAQRNKMQGFSDGNKIDDILTTIIPANYTGFKSNTNKESMISYFTEDIGFNSFYSYFFADYPIWMMNSQYGLEKDEPIQIILYFHRKLLARYNLERLSNDLGPIPRFSWRAPIKNGYYPDLRYYNGIQFPCRHNNHPVEYDQNRANVETVLEREREIRENYYKGYIRLANGKRIKLDSPESFEEIGNLDYKYDYGVDSNEKKTQYTGALDLCKKLLASSDKTDDSTPGILEHSETALRDPMFYQIYKRYLEYYVTWENQLPKYNQEETSFNGVTIDSVEVTKLITYFDEFEADISNAVDIDTNDPEPFLIKAKQWRLNHLPFKLKLNISSKRQQKSVVRLFMGPTHSVSDVNDNRDNFYLVDRWLVDLEVGKNVITRSCDEFGWFVRDRTTFYELYKNVMLSIKGEMKFPLDMTEAHIGFPYRLMLPKGKSDGMSFQFFFIIVPYTAPIKPRLRNFDPVISAGIGSGAPKMDSHSMGFPLDRKIDYNQWYSTNMYYHELMIFHQEKKMEKITIENSI